MPKYKITWQELINCWMELEADSEKEALERFKEGDFTLEEMATCDDEPGYNVRKIKAGLIDWRDE